MIFCLLLKVNSVFAHGLDCNSAPINFDEPGESVEDNLVLVDHLGSTDKWTELDKCLINDNLVSGDGDAACASGKSAPINITMETSYIFIGCMSQVQLKFRSYFHNPEEKALFFLQVFPDGAGDWIDVATLTNSHGDIVLGGELMTFDLTSFSGNGFAPVNIRWGFKSSGAAPESFVQIDDIELICSNGPQSDIDVKLTGPIGPIPYGSIRRYNTTLQNFGPVIPPQIDLTMDVLSQGIFVHPENIFAGTEVNTLSNEDNEITATLLDPSATNKVEFYFDVRFGTLPLSKATQGAKISDYSESISINIDSPVCDYRLNNNSQNRIVAVTTSQQSTAKLIKDIKKLKKLNKRLAKIAKCASTPTDKDRTIHQTITSKSARQTFSIMAPDFDDELLKLNKSVRKSGIKYFKNLPMCNSPLTKNFSKRIKSYQTRLLELFN